MPENEAKGWLGWLHPLSSSLPALADPVFFRRCHPAQKQQLLLVLSVFFCLFSPPPSHLYLGLADPPKKTSLVDGDGGG